MKDTARFEGGWAFFGFEGTRPAAPIPATAGCHSCHRAHAAVDTTFVQFYPSLLPVAQAAGTLSPEYLAAEAARLRKRRQLQANREPVLDGRDVSPPPRE